MNKNKRSKVIYWFTSKIFLSKSNSSWIGKNLNYLLWAWVLLDLWNQMSSVQFSWDELNWVELSWVQFSSVEMSWIELNWVELSSVEFSSVEMSWVELSWVELSLVELSWVELSWGIFETSKKKLLRVFPPLKKKFHLLFEI